MDVFFFHFCLFCVLFCFRLFIGSVEASYVSIFLKKKKQTKKKKKTTFI